MSQSPLARTTRRGTLSAFAHAPSKLSKSTTTENLKDDSPSPTKANGTSTKETYKTPVRANGRRASLDKTPAYASTSTQHTPHTPIHYSPYATSTPPAGLSKSASVPFDMAGSARAARIATEERRRTLSNPAPVDSPLINASSKKKRYVRRKSLAEKVKEYPQNLIDQFLLLSPSSVEDLLPPAHLANPIALGIHALHFLLVAPLWTTQDEAYSILRTGHAPSGAEGRWNKWEEEQSDRKSGLLGGWAVSKSAFIEVQLRKQNLVVTTTLVFFAALNSLYLFTRFRTYDMQLRSAKDPITSPHASPIKAPKRPEGGDDPFATGSGGSSSSVTRMRKVWRVIAIIVQWIYSAIMSALGKPRQSPPPVSAGEDAIQSLRVWDPPDFALRFFCAFPPPAPLLTRLLTPLHPLLTPILHLTSSVLLHHLASSYAQLVKDRMVLSAEVMREYDKRFVYKRIFSTRVDRSTQTNEGESARLTSLTSAEMVF